jgi:hypothetical protein
MRSINPSLSAAQIKSVLRHPAIGRFYDGLALGE